MKLIVGIVDEEDSKRLEKKLVENNIRVTKLASTGGFLRSGNTTFLSGVEDTDVEEVLHIYDTTCSKRKMTTNSPVPNPGGRYDFSVEFGYAQPIEVEVGGAVIFVLDVDQFHKI